MTAQAALPRRAVAELVGTAALVTVVVGSGIRAAGLSPDPGTALLANSLASAIGLGLLIALLSPVSGAHLNPVVTLCAWWYEGRRGRAAALEALTYVAAQLAGAAAGAVLADLMFGRRPGTWSTHTRSEWHLLLGETVATAGLVLLITGLRRTGRARFAPVGVAAYIAAAIWFTSSGSFANPAASVGRSLSDSFAGIAPASLPGFVAAQLVGGTLGAGLAVLLYGRPRRMSAASVRPAERARRGESLDLAS
ncbi:aquaporin [Streptomyces sp. NPDC015127]|uniref:aquaporin n=1 Tax=Streptomyces sp. NPDC015127 TaxID=3364939 RepID=UPI003702A4E8